MGPEVPANISRLNPIQLSNLTYDWMVSAWECKMLHQDLINDIKSRQETK